ncbi:phage tail assembly protein [Novosphingobium sp.]|uniref:phage tail assembly protein n=1 Tax=Novosphingobium sp. TaxID=1874826 RepID=UPI0031D30D0B
MTKTPTAPTLTLPGVAKAVTVKLSEPIKRDNGVTIDTLTLRRPNAGELRGLNVNGLVNGDIESLIALTPRIAMPTVGPHEAAALDILDIGEIGGAIYGFFTKKTAAPETDQTTEA